jgi:hypothetical protein
VWVLGETDAGRSKASGGGSYSTGYDYGFLSGGWSICCASGSGALLDTAD